MILYDSIACSGQKSLCVGQEQQAIGRSSHVAHNVGPPSSQKIKALSGRGYCGELCLHCMTVIKADLLASASNAPVKGWGEAAAAKAGWVSGALAGWHGRGAANLHICVAQHAIQAKRQRTKRLLQESVIDRNCSDHIFGGPPGCFFSSTWKLRCRTGARFDANNR